MPITFFFPRKVMQAAKNEEVRYYLGIIGLAIVAIAVNTRDMFTSFGRAFQQAAFQVGSIITTTGYATTDFNVWPVFSKTILVILMFVGACAGSTGGGIKVSPSSDPLQIRTQGAAALPASQCSEEDQDGREGHSSRSGKSYQYVPVCVYYDFCDIPFGDQSG